MNIPEKTKKFVMHILQCTVLLIIGLQLTIPNAHSAPYAGQSLTRHLHISYSLSHKYLNNEKLIICSNNWLENISENDPECRLFKAEIFELAKSSGIGGLSDEKFLDAIQIYMRVAKHLISKYGKSQIKTDNKIRREIDEIIENERVSIRRKFIFGDK